MNAGEIGTQAGRIFEYNLPTNWIFRSQEDQNDFGIDGEIELKDSKGKALGKENVFKVQIKGEERSSFIDEGRILSFALKMERLKYYFDFKVPVILVVVEVSSEKIFWLPITSNDNLREKTLESSGQESIQIHIPVENLLTRKDDHLAGKITTAVTECWDFLSIKGLKDSVVRYPTVSPFQLKRRIEDIGDVFFKAHHQQLNNLLFERNFNELYKKARDIFTSSIAPKKDQFIAVLYYWQAFQIAPYTKIRRENVEQNFEICHLLIKLAREQKDSILRLISIGKCRRAKFKLQLDQLFATHNSVGNFEDGSFERIVFNNETQEMYRNCCLSLQKLIELCNRLTRDNQYYVLSDLFVDIYSLILTFEGVHKSRGTKESIGFLEQWHKSMFMLTMTYCCITKDFFKIERLYLFLSTRIKDDPSATQEARELVLSKFPELEDQLNRIEQSILEVDDQRDFYALTIEEQKSYFSDTATSLDMDPNDPTSELGRIVDMGLKNYDPTSIMKNCESLFVHYRPGGMIAQSLGMHSAGGMHLLVCLKHRHAQGTGNLLTRLYGDSDSPDFGFSFKQSYCNKCTDCQPRPENWSWSLKWYESAVKENMELLRKYKF